MPRPSWIRRLFPTRTRPVTCTRLSLDVVELEHRDVPAVFVVSNTNDSGTGSLREAVASANSTPGADVIGFNVILSLTKNTITLTSGELALNDSVTINGPGSSLLTISGNNSSRVFNTSGGSNLVGITLQNMTITAGKSASGGGAINISNQSVQLNDVAITNSSASAGGAIFAGVNAAVTLVRTTVSGHTATFGGGIYCSQASSISLSDSAVVNNKATNAGGGLYAFGFSSTTYTIRNTTISGNSSNTGGGLRLAGLTGSVTIQNSTIVNNTSSLNAGGGLSRTGSAGSVQIESTILSGNQSAAAPDLSGTIDSIQFSAIGSLTGFSMASGANNIVGENLKLRALDFNGGYGLTHSFEYDSPVRGKGSNPAALPYDARGQSRNDGKGVDIGAFELQSLVFNTDEFGTGSLRSAIEESNRVKSADTITFDAGVFSGASTISLFNELVVTDAITITGPNAPLTIHGSNSTRLINGSGAPSASDIHVSRIQFTAGKASRGGAFYIIDQTLSLTDVVITNCTATNEGGAISIDSANTSTRSGQLNLTRCTLIGNSAGGNGGGVDFSAGDAATIIDSSLVNNQCGGSGGGIFFTGNSFTLRNSTVDSNRTAGSGGGIAMPAISKGGTATVNESSIVNNTAGGTGGGFHVYSIQQASFTIRNSTLSGNSSSNSGGGIALPPFVNGTTTTIQNSTIVNNTAGGGSGGGIARSENTGSLNLESTIVNGNVNSSVPDISSAGTVTINFCAVGSTFGFSPIGGNNLIGANLKLGPLTAVGTQFVHIPATDSPLRDAGSNPASLTTDQRGSGFPRVLSAKADIGSIELNPSFVVNNTNDIGSGSLRQTILDANAMAGTQTITFDPTVFNSAKTITLTSGQLPTINDTLTITGPGAIALTISGNNASRTLEIAAGTTATLSGLTLTQGKVTGGIGGAILNRGTLNVAHCNISGNSASYGGAIFNYSGTATISSSTISGNTVNGLGGGLWNSGTLVVTNATLSGNSAGRGGGAYLGGGTANFVNITISGNTSADFGGGIHQQFGSATATNTIIAGNVAVVDVDYSTTGSLGGTNNLIGISAAAAGLGTLGYYGGNTPTIPLLPGSPAVNAGTSTFTTDQRGLPRFGAVDIGAFEYIPTTFVVDNVTDIDDGQTGSGQLSLREALRYANVNPGSNTINFSLANPATITLSGTQLPTVTDTVVMNGPGAKSLTISGNNASRIFEIAPGVNADIRGVTLSQGKVAGGAGGAILNFGSTTLTGTVLSGNSASYGGAIFNDSGTATISSSTISGNTVNGLGGGLWNFGTLVVSNTTLSGNSAGRGGGAYLGGGTANFVNTTISGNTSADFGGGIHQQFGTATATNTIIAGNVAVVDVDYSTTGSLGGSNNILNMSAAAAGLGLFGYYGGSTPTISLLPGSPAINGGLSSGAPATDQRGLARVGAVDIGAFELQPTPVTTIVLNTTMITPANVGPNGFTVTATFATPMDTSVQPLVVFPVEPVNGTLTFASSSWLSPTEWIVRFNVASSGVTLPDIDLRIAGGQDPSGTVMTPFEAPNAFGIALSQPPEVMSFTINGGNPQRSRLTTIRVDFAAPVTPAQFNVAGAISLTSISPIDSVVVQTGASGANGLIVVTQPGPATSLTLTFANANGSSLSAGVEYGSLADGRYRLNIGNFSSTPATQPIHRLFGDFDGNATVDATDFSFFPPFGACTNNPFDFNNNGDIDSGTDFANFGNRYGLTL